MTTASQKLLHWKSYLSLEDYEYLVEYIENSKNKKLNGKIIVLYGKDEIEKTILIREICDYLGDSGYAYYRYVHGKPPENMIVISDFDLLSSNHKEHLLYCVKYYGNSAIMETNQIETIMAYEPLKSLYRIIEMKYTPL